ncbi:ArsR/SmtB family transcription factor [Polycladidibacter hongkongensis]|uniref:ArsR/SmtB family transcription factor n=1 Tax=Polycladidibacter hongkongensis TaxID=1647556 RepID=UPI00082E5AD2|nr:metalloregulator ArsR/SmtB family transcription factor [Pseudovibrio hongkongensis]
MEPKRAAKAFKELGHIVRLDILRHLVRAGRRGCPVGELQLELGIPNSTLSHHIHALMEAGLVIQQREGRVLRCFADFNVVEALGLFLAQECGADLPPKFEGLQPISTVA